VFSAAAMTSRPISAATSPALDSTALFATGPGGARPPTIPTETPEPTATNTPTPKKTATPKPTATKSTTTTTSKPVLKGNVYTGANKAYTVTFDASIWTAEALEPSDGYDGVKLSSDNSLAWIEMLTTSLSLDDCVSGSISLLNKEDGFSNVVATDELDAPTTAKGVSATMITFTLTTDNGASDFTGYVECRTLVKGKSVVRTEFLTAMTRLDDALPTWTDVLAGIKIAKTSTTGKATATATPKPKKTPKATATSTSSGGDTFPDVKGNTFTSPAFGFTFTWPSKFIPILASGSDTGDLVAISDGVSTALLFSKSTDDGTTAKSCLDEKEQALINSDTLTNVAVATDNSGKEIRGKTSTGLYVLYSYNDKDGVPEFDYLRCDVDPTGTYVLDLTFISPQSEFGTTSDDLTAMIDGIKFP
jgi:hypothetical protein